MYRAACYVQDWYHLRSNISTQLGPWASSKSVFLYSVYSPLFMTVLTNLLSPQSFNRSPLSSLIFPHLFLHKDTLEKTSNDCYVNFYSLSFLASNYNRRGVLPLESYASATSSQPAFHTYWILHHKYPSSLLCPRSSSLVNSAISFLNAPFFYHHRKKNFSAPSLLAHAVLSPLHKLFKVLNCSTPPFIINPPFQLLASITSSTACYSLQAVACRLIQTQLSLLDFSVST